MSGQQVQLSRLNTNDPTLADLLNIYRRSIMLDFNCHHLATIQSFDPVKLTVTATINYKKTFFQQNAKTKLYDRVLVDYPLLADIPVVFLSGGTAGVTFPIDTGDQALILFNDRDLDNWFQSGQTGPVASGRLHSFSDGVALIGPRSLANPIANYDSTRAVLYNGQTKIAASATKVLITNALTISLGQALSNLMTALSAFATTAATSTTDPTLVTAATALGTAVTAVTLELGGLLE